MQQKAQGLGSSEYCLANWQCQDALNIYAYTHRHMLLPALKSQKLPFLGENSACQETWLQWVWRISNKLSSPNYCLYFYSYIFQRMVVEIYQLNTLFYISFIKLKLSSMQLYFLKFKSLGIWESVGISDTFLWQLGLVSLSWLVSCHSQRTGAAMRSNLSIISEKQNMHFEKH